jgi:hypothetical protein
VSVPIKSLPASLNGTYSLFGQVTDASGDVADSSAGPSLTAAAPFIAFTPSIVKTTLPAPVVSSTNTHATVVLSITNGGNITSTGTSTIALYLSSNQSAGAGATSLLSKPLHLAIAPGKSAKVTVAITSIPALAAGSYYLVAEVTDSSGDLTTAASSAPLTVAAPSVTLQSITVTGLPATVTSGSTSKADAVLKLTANASDFTATGENTITLSFVAGTSAAVPIKTVTMTIKFSIKGTSVRVPLGSIPALTSGTTYELFSAVTPSAPAPSL